MLVVFVVPFAFIALTAVKDRAESARLDFSWPSSWHVWENLREVVTTRNNLFVTAMRNSFVVTVVSVAVLVIFCAMAGFVLERRRDRMATLVSAAVLAGLIIPPAVVPTIYVLQEIHLFNSLWGLVLVEVAYLARSASSCSAPSWRRSPPARRGGDDRQVHRPEPVLPRDLPVTPAGHDHRDPHRVRGDLQRLRQPAVLPAGL